MCHLPSIGQFSNADSVRAAGCRGNCILVPLMTHDLDVDVVVAHLSIVNVKPAGLGKSQEGAEAQQVDRSDEGKHRCPRAGGLDEIPREIHQKDP